VEYEEKILALCDEWQRELAERATNIATAHHREVSKRRDECVKTTDWYRYNVRTRMVNGSIQIHWLKSEWIRMNGKNKLVGEYLKPSVKYGYYEKTFRGASDEELLKIMAAEEKLSKIRKRARVVGLIRNAIKLNQKSEIEDPI